MRVNQNVQAFNAYRHVSDRNRQVGKSVEQLSSGSRINRAADDAAGLVLSQSLRAQVSGLRVATRNAQDGISLVQVADGALSEIHDLLIRVRELAVQAANTATVGVEARAAAQAEVDQLVAEIDNIVNTTKFGGSMVFDGSVQREFQIGADSGEVFAMGSSGAGLLDLGLDGSTTNLDSASATLGAVDGAITMTSYVRSFSAALHNRFERVVRNLEVTTENLAASEARIRDADMAGEVVNLTRNQIMGQASTAMLAQANKMNRSALQLLRT